MQKCDFNKVALQIIEITFSIVKPVVDFQKTFLYEHLLRDTSHASGF